MLFGSVCWLELVFGFQFVVICVLVFEAFFGCGAFEMEVVNHALPTVGVGVLPEFCGAFGFYSGNEMYDYVVAKGGEVALWLGFV